MGERVTFPPAFTFLSPGSALSASSALFQACRRVAVRAAAVAVFAMLPVGLAAQTPASPEEMLGYPLGAHFTSPVDAVAYAEYLAEESSGARIFQYGRTVEGRPLVQLALGTPANLARLDEILAANRQITDIDITDAAATEVARSNPAIVYFSYGVHGDEASSTDAALWTAWDLLGGDGGLAPVLDSLIVVIDPVTNPDGRARYVDWYRSVVGSSPDANPQAREHSPPWPGGRYNHFLFDLNRDWAWLSQPETRARIETWSRWNPQVHVDFHEMSPRSSYFFFPASAPINPIYPEHILRWGETFGQANVAAFDRRGWRYFTGEVYDLFYPGYGDSWPSLLGAIGMTYEQAGGGAAGLAWANSNGDTLTLADRIQHHRVSGAATLRTAAGGKTELLRDFARFHRTAGVDEPDVLLVPGDDPGRLDSLVDHLLAQGIQLERALSPFVARAVRYPGMQSREAFPTGTIRVRARQSRGRLALTLLQASTELIGQGSYDITAWALPFAYGVEAHRVSSALGASWETVQPMPAVAQAPPTAGYGYLLPPNDRATAAVVRLAGEGVDAWVIGRPSVFAGREWPSGSYFLPILDQPEVADLLTAAGVGDIAAPLNSGLSESGPDIGSESTVGLTVATVGLMGGEGFDPTSYGAHWFYLDQVLGLPYSQLRIEEIEDLDLSRYGVIVLPDMRGQLTPEASERLGAWTRSGGRLIAVGGGAAAIAPLAEVTLRGESDGDAEPLPSTLLATRAERDSLNWERTIPGTILPASADPDHPLMWGSGAPGDPSTLYVLHQGNPAFEPKQGAEAAAFFPARVAPLSGTISAAGLDGLAESVWLLSERFGGGEIVLFADDPLFRMFWKSTFGPYRNALLLGL